MGILTATVRAGLLGAAVGGRASAGLTALTARPAPSDPAWLRSRALRIGSRLSSVGEGIGDQLPQTPSRLAPAGLAPRVLIGGLSGAVLLRRHGHSSPIGQIVGAAVGAAAAFGGAQAGARWRSVAAQKFGHDTPGALIEDAVVTGLGLLAVQ